MPAEDVEGSADQGMALERRSGRAETHGQASAVEWEEAPGGEHGAERGGPHAEEVGSLLAGALAFASRGRHAEAHAEAVAGTEPVRMVGVS